MDWNDRQDSSGGGVPSRRVGLNEQPWKPLLTYTLLGAIAAVFLLQVVIYDMYRRGGTSFVIWHGLPQTWYHFLFVINTDWMWRPWSLVSSTFSHDASNIMHILFNGMSLFFFGPSVERLLGRKRALALFLIGGALAGVAQVHLSAWQEEGNPLDYRLGGGALGASGALMAFLGLLMVLTPRQQMFLMMVPVPVPMWIAGIVYAAIDVLGVFNPASGIGHVAHLAGLVLGLATGFVVLQRWKREGIRVVYGA